MATATSNRTKKPADRPPAAAPAPKRASRPPTARRAAFADATQAAPPARELLEGPTREDLIRRRAFDLYERNGCVDGRALDDWLAAESEVGDMVLEGTAPAEAGTGG
jgi:hypothetical protein